MRAMIRLAGPGRESGATHMAKATARGARSAATGLFACLFCLALTAARAQTPDAATAPPPPAPAAQPVEPPLAPVAAPPAPAPPAAAPPTEGSLAPVAAPASPAEQPGQPDAVAPPPPVPVQGEALNPLDLFAAGRDTGLGQDLWRGASADLARSVIPPLGDHPLSPAAAALARRVLAASAAAPDGAGSDSDLAAARARVLLALGDAPTAALILDRTAGLANSAALSQTAAEAALIDDEDDKACAIGEALSVGRDGAYWLRLRAYCQARAGKPAAQLTMTLAEDADHDPAFARMLPVIIAGAGDPGPASLHDGLDYAMSRRLKLDLAPAMADAPPAIALRLAADTAGLGAAPPATAPVEADILAGLRKAKGVRAYATAARLALPAIAQLVQSKATLTNPVQLATAALAAGDAQTAQATRLGLADTVGTGADPADLAILDAALAVAAGKADPPTLDRLIERGARAGDASGRAQAAAALVLALGWPVDGQARAEFAGFSIGRARASAATLLLLDSAAEQGVRGDVALLALGVAEASGEAGPEPADRAALIRDLDRVGLKADAQGFALEGLIGLEAR
jgi:hypothetical protein